MKKIWRFDLASNISLFFCKLLSGRFILQKSYLSSIFLSLATPFVLCIRLMPWLVLMIRTAYKSLWAHVKCLLCEISNWNNLFQFLTCEKCLSISTNNKASHKKVANQSTIKIWKICKNIYLPGCTSSQSTPHWTPNCEEKSLKDFGSFQGLIFQQRSLSWGTVVGLNPSLASNGTGLME